MSFSDYKDIAQVQKEFQIKYAETRFITAPALEPPTQLTEDLNFYLVNIDVYASEASRCELIISPVLKELYKRHYDRYSFWVQKPIAYNAVLSGTPDYIFSMRSSLGKTVLELPLLLIVAAKKNDFEQGWGQCLAALVTAQKLNESSKRPVYGCVTDGNLWQLGQLAGSVFTKNFENYTIDHLPNLFGALDFILQAAGVGLVV